MALGKGTAGGGGGLKATILLGFKRPLCAVGTQDRLFQLMTMRAVVLLAALVAAVAGTETFVG